MSCCREQPKKSSKQRRQEEAAAFHRSRQMEAMREAFRRAGRPVPACYDYDAQPVPSTNWSLYTKASEVILKPNNQPKEEIML
jgi:hypothetical protein